MTYYSMMFNLTFINIGILELVIIILALVIPITTTIFLLVSYSRKQTKLKEEQNSLLQKIADK